MITDSNTTKMSILRGAKLLSDTVKVTLGTKGRLVMYTNYRDFSDPEGYPVLTKDGVTVAKNVKSDDPVEQQAIKIVRQAAKNTVNSSGDGPQPLYAKVLTPNGFVTMGSLKVGDEICGTDGSIQKVLEIHPKGLKKVCNVKFSRGKVVECCEDHLWEIHDLNGYKSIKTTREIYDSGLLYHRNSGKHQLRFFVRKPNIDFSEKELTVPPYLLGILISNPTLSDDNNKLTVNILQKKASVIRYINEYHNVSMKTYIDDSPESVIRSKANNTYYTITFEDNTLLDQLRDLKIFDTDYYSRVIPDIYKYSSYLQREDILNGFIDGSGSIKNRRTFQYKTASSTIKDDFIELCQSLGQDVKNKRYTTTENGRYLIPEPIYKIYEVSNYKYGDRIEDIEFTDTETEMMCIKVSNEDHLYITDNYISTHNTTTTVILSESIISKGYELLSKGNVSSWEMNKEIDEAVEDISQYILDNSTNLSNDITALRELASISANSKEIGTMIYDIVDELSIHCDIEVKKTKRNITEIEAVNGMKLHKGYYESFMCNDYKSMTFQASNVNILIYDGIIKDYSNIAPYVKASIDDDNNIVPLVIYAQDVNRIAINRIEGMLKYNPRPLIIVEHDGFGDRRIDIMEDFALITGATIVTENSNNNVIMIKNAFGKCDEVFINDKYSSFVGGKGNQDLIDDQILDIQDLIKNTDPNNKQDIRFYNKRIANLSGGIAVIHVGGNTPFEMEEKYMRIDDAVLAVKSAIASGISIGGGVTWIRASHYAINKTRGYNRIDNPAYFMVFDSLQEIPMQLLKNSGEYTSEFFKELKSKYLSDKPKGYNLVDRKFYDISNYKVMDATSVLLDAISNSSSVAKSLLSVEKAIHFDNNVTGLN